MRGVPVAFSGSNTGATCGAVQHCRLPKLASQAASALRLRHSAAYSLQAAVLRQYACKSAARQGSVLVVKVHWGVGLRICCRTGVDSTAFRPAGCSHPRRQREPGTPGWRRGQAHGGERERRLEQPGESTRGCLLTTAVSAHSRPTTLCRPPSPSSTSSSRVRRSRPTAYACLRPCPRSGRWSSCASRSGGALVQAPLLRRPLLRCCRHCPALLLRCCCCHVCGCCLLGDFPLSTKSGCRTGGSQLPAACS